MFWSTFSDWTAWNYITALADIMILSFVAYKIIMLVRGTRAVQLIKGIIVLLIVAALAGLLGLNAVKWILNQVWAVIFVALAVLFQPELRRMLERLGRGNLFSSAALSVGDIAHLIDAVVGAVVAGAKTKNGMLIIIERRTGLSDYIETGILVDASVTQELLGNIFVVNTPLHDGAAILRGTRVAAAACFLPLSDNPYISLSLGTRHRAGIGITEVSDALALIVSEETGVISLAREGKLVRYLDERQLRELLSAELSSMNGSGQSQGGGMLHG